MPVYINPEWKTPQQNICMSSGAVHIWVAELNSLSVCNNTFYGILSVEERARADKFKLEKDRNYFIAARGVLKRLLALYLNTVPQQINFRYNQYGKPFLNNPEIPIFFNLSHSGDLALFIFSNKHEVGIDLEEMHFIENYLEIAQQFFSSSELSKLKSISPENQLEAFFRGWTRKEAFIKAIGEGLSYPLKQFEVSFCSHEPNKVLNIKGDHNLAKQWTLGSMSPAANYEAAFIFKGQSDNIEFWHYVY